MKVPGVGDDAFGFGEIGLAAKLGNRCIKISGLTRAEFRDNYAPDAAMARWPTTGRPRCRTRYDLVFRRQAQLPNHLWQAEPQ